MDLLSFVMLGQRSIILYDKFGIICPVETKIHCTAWTTPGNVPTVEIVKQCIV
jgi:hypothetical protein